MCVDRPAKAKLGVLPVSTSTQWPLQRVARLDGSCVLIGRPRWASPFLFGRCTRGYVVYDRAKAEAYFMKDSWPVDHPEARREHRVYERLAAAGVENVLTCCGGEEVPVDVLQNLPGGAKPPPQCTHTFDYAATFDSSASAVPTTNVPRSRDEGDDDCGPATQDEVLRANPTPRRTFRYPRIHYRIFIKEICRPLTDFADWRELLVFLTHVLRGK